MQTLFTNTAFVSAFTTISYKNVPTTSATSACLYTENREPLNRFSLNFILGSFTGKFSIWLKPDNNNENFTWRPTCVFSWVGNPRLRNHQPTAQPYGRIPMMKSLLSQTGARYTAHAKIIDPRQL
jgi:hypothetical protein